MDRATTTVVVILQEEILSAYMYMHMHMCMHMCNFARSEDSSRPN